MSDDYRTLVDAVVHETAMPESSVARIEARLQEAFARQLAAAPAVAPKRRRRRVGWMAAAAALVLLVGVAGWRLGVVTLNDVTAPAVTSGVAPKLPASPPQAHGRDTDRVLERVASAGHRRRVHSPTRLGRPTVIKPAGFVELPGTAALPAFESGAIVRMELPVASLPAYGVDISAGGANQPVEADVLVGQDGRARAIRLVTNSLRSVQ